MRTSFVATCLVAATLLAGAAHAEGVKPAKATAAQKQEAQARFGEGREAYEKADYATAVTKFTASLEVVDSPNTRLYLARSLREAGRPGDAYAEFFRTENDAGKEPRYHDAASAAHDEKASLASSVGSVHLDVKNADDTTTATVGGKEVPKKDWGEPVIVAAGDTEVVVTRNGKTEKKTVHVTAGSTAEATFDGSSEGGPSGSGDDKGGSGEAHAEVDTGSHADHTNLRPFAYVAGGVGAAGFLTFIIAGIAANGTYGDLQDACPNGRCSSNQQDAISRGKTQQTIANIGLVFGVLGAGAGVALYVISMPPKQDATTPPASAALRVGPTGAFVQGRF